MIPSHLCHRSRVWHKFSYAYGPVLKIWVLTHWSQKCPIFCLQVPKRPCYKQIFVKNARILKSAILTKFSVHPDFFDQSIGFLAKFYYPMGSKSLNFVIYSIFNAKKVDFSNFSNLKTKFQNAQSRGIALQMALFNLKRQ